MSDVDGARGRNRFRLAFRRVVRRNEIDNVGGGWLAAAAGSVGAKRIDEVDDFQSVFGGEEFIAIGVQEVGPFWLDIAKRAGIKCIDVIDHDQGIASDPKTVVI